MDEHLGPMGAGGRSRRVSARRKRIRHSTIKWGAALFILVSLAPTQGSPPGTSSVLQSRPLAQVSAGAAPQAGLGSLTAPTLIVQPGPPPVPIGEPQLRRPDPPGDARPALPDFESGDGAAELRVGPSSVEGVDKPDRDVSGKKAGSEATRQP